MTTPANPAPVAEPIPFRCEACCFWRPTEQRYDLPYQLGECRRYAPGLHYKPDGRVFTKWPSTRIDDGCGDFRTAKANPNREPKQLETAPLNSSRQHTPPQHSVLPA